MQHTILDAKKKLIENAFKVFLITVVFLYYTAASPLLAQTLNTLDISTLKQPSSSDISRIKTNPNPPPTLNNTVDLTPAPLQPASKPSEETLKQIKFILNDIKITGGTVFSQKNLRTLYKKHLGNNIPLEVIYTLAQSITDKYQKSGYLSSLAFVPQQNIVNGIVHIHIIEGFLEDIALPEHLKNDSVINAYIHDLKRLKPIKTYNIESFLLRLNDLGIGNVTGTLSVPKTNAPNTEKQGALILSLSNTPQKPTLQLSFDNNLSKLLGVHEGIITYNDSFAPRHKTTLSVIKSAIFKRLTHLSLHHEYAILPRLKFDVTTSYTHSKPGGNLELLDLQTSSRFLSFGINFNIMRQRLENLDFKLSLDSRDTNTDLKAFNIGFIRDQIRTVRLNAKYNKIDNWNGGTFIDTTLSQGLNGLGATNKNSETLSRSEAIPNFQKLELAVTRIQNLTTDLSLVATGLGQVASSPLFSAEEIGYGGQVFGRAFDASELTGDHGLLTSLELRYYGIKKQREFRFHPYGFYDIGRLWNKDSTEIAAYQTAASAGFGVRISNNDGLNANASVAIPLIKDVQAPIYGRTNSDARFSFQLLQNF